ncbi:ligand-binding sensor domain-containing protein [Chitinophaga polysaccharea]|uniref:ligand-binding sensor domain-containing protein n=1 Tax=Chitinophaga polysaccharea TaxID=1293035 RepID=UPI0021AE96CE|nr:two-component regulator propeller domain-containing protein [Chitinophaga polysaccharea]
MHNAVTAVIQDSTGLIWVGTRGGLNRFDGYSFKAYKNNNDKFGSLGNDVINCIAEDKNRMIWIATGKGIFKYNLYKEVLTELETVPKEYTNNIVIDKDNNLWFLIQFSLYKYIQAENRVEDLKTKASYIALDSNMNLWMGDNDGNIHIYNPKKKPAARIRIINKNLPANARSISKIYPLIHWFKTVSFDIN